MAVGGDAGDHLGARDRGHGREAGDAVRDEVAALEQCLEGRRIAFLDRPLQHVGPQRVDVGEDQSLIAHRSSGRMMKERGGGYLRIRRPSCLRWARRWRARPSQGRAMMTIRVRAGSSRAATATITATSETRNPIAPLPPPSRLPAPKTTSLTTMQP